MLSHNLKDFKPPATPWLSSENERRQLITSRGKPGQPFGLDSLIAPRSPEQTKKRKVLEQEASDRQPAPHVYDFTPTTRCTLPAGKYHIGDPRRFLDHRLRANFNLPGNGLYKHDNDRLFVATPVHRGTDGRESFSVIAIAPEQLIRTASLPVNVLNFESPVICTFEDGLLSVVSGGTSLIIDAKYG